MTIGHNGYSFDDVVQENLECGLYWAQRDCLIRAIRDPELGHRHRVVIAELIAMTNATSGMAYPGRKALADATGYTEAGIAKTICELVDMGYVVSTRRAPEVGRRPLAHYSIVKPTSEELRSAIDAHIEAIRNSNVTPVGNVTYPPNFTPRGNVTRAKVTPVGNVTCEQGGGGNVTPVDRTVTSTVSSSTERPVEAVPEIKEPASAPAIRGTRLDPNEVLCRQCGTWAIANHEITRAQAFSEWQQFSDFWTSKAGKDSRKLDWFKTWCNWIRSSKKNYRAKSPLSTADAGFFAPAKATRETPEQSAARQRELAAARGYEFRPAGPEEPGGPA